MTLLQADANLGGYSILSNETVGPQIGGELRQKGVLAVVFSLLGMLAYIWYRFELRFGIGALVAVFHDFLIVLGIYAIMKLEFNLSSIAAFLTLVRLLGQRHGGHFRPCAREHAQVSAHAVGGRDEPVHQPDAGPHGDDLEERP